MGGAIGVIVVCATLVFDPTWPLRWLATIGTYERMIPVLVLPFGPLLLLAPLRWRDERARLLLLIAVLPMRHVYDLTILWLIPSTWPQAATLSIISWVGWLVQPLRQPIPTWAVPLLYLTALLFVFYPLPCLAISRARWQPQPESAT